MTPGMTYEVHGKGTRGVVLINGEDVYGFNVIITHWVTCNYISGTYLNSDQGEAQEDGKQTAVFLWRV